MYRDWGRQADLTSRTNEKWPSLPRDYDARFIYEKIGYNLSPLELQAAMGRVQLRKTARIKKLRRRNFDYLYQELSKIPQLIMPRWVDGAEPSWFSFPITTKGERGELVAFLEENGIETRSMFAGNIVLHPAYAGVQYRDAGINEANTILHKSFWVSVHPRYTPKQLKYIVKTIQKFYDLNP
jgi:CDP-6-deoxy-D-xylo-4-hexulose-3-dehydrase